MMQCYLVEFLFSLIRGAEGSVTALTPTRDSRQFAESSLIDSILQFIQNNIDRPPSLELICDRFSVSRTYLHRIFKEATGSSPVDYWIGLKMKEAKKQIREGDKNITQIAESLGFSGIHHFTRMFKRVTGMCPTAYRSTIGR